MLRDDTFPLKHLSSTAPSILFPEQKVRCVNAIQFQETTWFFFHMPSNKKVHILGISMRKHSWKFNPKQQNDYGKPSAP
jgi:hypothetical protein